VGCGSLKYLAVDVCYSHNVGQVAGVLFTRNSNVENTYLSTARGIADYESGEFYKRELPCIEKLINEHKLVPDCVIVDGYVYLEHGKPGLGKHLYQSMNGTTPVIGVAKNPRGIINEQFHVLRGESLNPLYVTSEGIDLEEAKALIKNLEGPFRIPSVIKLADTLCRREFPDFSA